MVANHQQIVIAVAVPSILVLFGIAYLRRKKSGVHCDTGGNNNNNKSRIKSVVIDETKTHVEGDTKNIDVSQDLKRSQSLPCAANNATRDLIDRQTGKSAPIDIAPNPRSPPAKVTEQQIDAEILKLKLEESDYKNLKAIRELTDDEFSADSPRYLPGSVERRRFSLTPQQSNHEEPVVVKATIMTTKLSMEPERDSANSSPTQHINKEEEEPQTEVRNEPATSPPLSLYSVHSGDSGKGSSPPHSDQGVTTYDFIVPVSLVQHLIGAKGRYVKQLKAKTGVNMIVNDHPTSRKERICSIEGSQRQIEVAIDILRKKLPAKRYPMVTFQRVYTNEVVPFDPASCQVSNILRVAMHTQTELISFTAPTIRRNQQ